LKAIHVQNRPTDVDMGDGEFIINTNTREELLKKTYELIKSKKELEEEIKYLRGQNEISDTNIREGRVHFEISDTNIQEDERRWDSRDTTEIRLINYVKHKDAISEARSAFVRTASAP